VSSPPGWLPPATFIPKKNFSVWPKVGDLATNTKRAAIIEALKTVLPL
jgi:hypothetical protein